MTLRLSDAEFDLALRPTPKLSRIPPGHWRCKWRLRDGIRARVEANAPGVIILDDRTWIFATRFVSRELADEDARTWPIRSPYLVARAVYVEAVFFPGERS